MRYAVIGAAGQLGRDLCPRLEGDIVRLDRVQADLTVPDLMRSTLTAIRPDCVINCAAYNFVDQAESEPQAAIAVNTRGVRDLARICRDVDATLVHFSTDYVFGLDFHRTKPFETSDAPGPISIYGMSKLLGEYAVQAECPKHFVIRTCGLYGVWGSGGKGRNFVETMLTLGGQGRPLRVVADQHCTPSYTVDVADCAVQLISTNEFGLYHVTNSGATTWHDVARAAFELSGMSADLTPIATAEYPTPARRPTYSVLSLGKLQTIGVPTPRPWRDAIAAYLDERRHKKSS